MCWVLLTGVCLILKAFINIECVSVMCFNITDGWSLAVVRSNCRGWKWSSVRWLRIKRSSSGTCWNWRSTHTCWESHARSCTAAPGWVSIHQHSCGLYDMMYSDLNYCKCESTVSKFTKAFGHLWCLWWRNIQAKFSYLPKLAFFCKM